MKSLKNYINESKDSEESINEAKQMTKTVREFLDWLDNDLEASDILSKDAKINSKASVMRGNLVEHLRDSTALAEEGRKTLHKAYKNNTKVKMTFEEGYNTYVCAFRIGKYEYRYMTPEVMK